MSNTMFLGEYECLRGDNNDRFEAGALAKAQKSRYKGESANHETISRDTCQEII